MIRRGVVVALLLALTGCFFGRDAAPAPSPSPTRTRPGTTTVDQQRVVVAHGATVIQAGLVRSCTGDTCEERPGARLRVLAAGERRPILSVTFEQVPDSVEGLIVANGKTLSTQQLQPGTLVAWRPKVPSGPHVARIVATFGEDRVVWAFRIAGA